jgi:CRISPR/Cas system CSM-associated protein Csm2 small subunit
MDVNALTALIGSVGFPIVACCFLFVQLNRQTETLNELKIVLTKLIDKLDVEDLDVKLEK